jgi:hypothetical protein
VPKHCRIASVDIIHVSVYNKEHDVQGHPVLGSCCAADKAA